MSLMDYRLVVTRGQGGQGGRQSKGVKYVVTERNLNMEGEHTV